MNRTVFMERLRECLADISAEEREDALTYYESYFEEAGVENEAQVIEELGSPEKVAENIKRDLLEEPQSSIQAPECMEKESSEEFSSEDFEKHEQYEEYEQKDKSGRIAMIIVIAVLTFPIWITVAIDDCTRLSNIISELRQYAHVLVEDRMTIVSVVDNMQWEYAGFEAKIMEALKDIPLRMISYGSSNNDVAFVIKNTNKKRALQALNDKLFQPEYAERN